MGRVAEEMDEGGTRRGAAGLMAQSTVAQHESRPGPLGCNEEYSGVLCAEWRSE